MNENLHFFTVRDKILVKSKNVRQEHKLSSPASLICKKNRMEKSN